MRRLADAERVQTFLEELGRAASKPVRIYLVGGATAVLEGWRGTTIDIDFKLVPDSDKLLRELPRLKDKLEINVELASPDEFIPELPGWLRSRWRQVPATLGAVPRPEGQIR